MIIHIVNVDRQTKPTKTGKGTYEQLEIAYRDENGKMASKVVMAFANKSVFDTLSTASKGDTFDVVSEKNDKGYWNWTSAQRAVGNISAPAEEPSSGRSKGGTNTYVDPRETREERELRQKHIIRQSCLAQAVAWLSRSAQEHAENMSSEDVMEVAAEFEAWVTREAPMTIDDLESDPI